MTKCIPLTEEQKIELTSWVQKNRELVDYVYIPQFAENTRWYQTQEIYMCGVMVSKDLDLLRDNYLYNKMIQNKN